MACTAGIIWLAQAQGAKACQQLPTCKTRRMGITMSSFITPTLSVASGRPLASQRRQLETSLALPGLDVSGGSPETN